MSRIVNDNVIGTDCPYNFGYGDPVAFPLRKLCLEFDEAAIFI